MKKSNKIAYWIFTIFLCLGPSGGIGQLFQIKEIVGGFAPLGYPMYFFSIIGFWKTIAIFCILAPKLPRAMEWAYAGVFFVMAGACFTYCTKR